MRIPTARALVALGAVALVAAGCATAAPAPAAGASPTTPTATAPPATGSGTSPSVAPRSPRLALEACGEITHFQDGNIGPLLCPDGRPSLAADAFLRSMVPALAVLRVGSDANLTDVETAMCADKTFAHVTNPVEESAYRLMTAEEGWGFGDEPPAWLLRQAC